MTSPCISMAELNSRKCTSSVYLETFNKVVSISNVSLIIFTLNEAQGIYFLYATLPDLSKLHMKFHKNPLKGIEGGKLVKCSFETCKLNYL